MRRKSERNKGKQSPEKKPEKPTRKSTRRRAKKSPSTSPERSHSPENKFQQEKDPQSLVPYKIQTRLQSKDTPETVIEEPESKVSSTEQITGDDANSVWKVARADASPGEIQKLKLCRQRNLSETSDASLSRKRMTKLPEGEGIAEEADSADERPATSNDKAYTIGLADDTSSTTIDRESGEEVSDSKDIPPETTTSTVDLSDVKHNIDYGVQHADDHDDNDNDDNDDDDVHKQQSKHQHEGVNVMQNQQNDSQLGHEDESVGVPGSEHNIVIQHDNDNVEIDKIQILESNDESRASDKEEFIQNIDQHEKNKIDDDNDKKIHVNESVEESEEKKSDDEEEDEPKIKETIVHDNSLDNEHDDRTSRTRISRRKHRDKYRDSSNSDSGESEEETGRRERREESPEVQIEKKQVVENDGRRKEEEEEKESPQGEKSSQEAKVVEKNEVEEKREEISGVVENDKEEEEKREEKPQNVYRPARVNLKRSFTSRISMDELKKDNAGSLNDASQDKENHVADESRSIPKRRRWGTVLSTDIPVLSISTDSLKALVPGAKPLSLNEVRLSNDDEDDRDRRKDKRQMVNDGDKSRADNDNKNDNSKDNHLGVRRKISIVKETPQLLSSSPLVVQPTSILLIKNLVRPFTLNQIKELLSRTGTIVENGFWMDRIKSKCFVEYANEDQAFETRQALHGISWPPSNPKKLQVEYSIKEEMEKAKESSKDHQPLSRKLEASSGGDMWQQDWGRDDKTNLTTKVTVVREWDLGKEDGQHLLLKDKEKEKKDMDKKRRQRSGSPTREAHLPAPARKFKKKEDEPPPAKLLDDLFRKTKSTPCIYWLPLTNEQIVVNEEMRQQRMAEYARRLEMRRAERNRDGRRRRSPRK